MLVGFAHQVGGTISDGSYVSPAPTSRSGTRRPQRSSGPRSWPAQTATPPTRPPTGSRTSPTTARIPPPAPTTDWTCATAPGSSTSTTATTFWPPASTGEVRPRGFDYCLARPSAAAYGTPRRNAYTFIAPGGTSHLRACLVWNIRIGEDPARWTGAATLHHLDLALYDLTTGDPELGGLFRQPPGQHPEHLDAARPWPPGPAARHRSRRPGGFPMGLRGRVVHSALREEPPVRERLLAALVVLALAVGHALSAATITILNTGDIQKSPPGCPALPATSSSSGPKTPTFSSWMPGTVPTRPSLS